MPELFFKGKEFVYNHHLTVPYRPLEMNAKKSIGKPSLNGNLIIHGDNLHALKALLPLYAGKVDCIFIDPPYNTGNEGWNYNDNVNSPMMKEWLSSNPVNSEDMLRHDKWCSMMWPRLTLLRELLSDGGLIAITIDDNELPDLWLLMDSIFGEENLVACAPWLSEPSGGKEKTGLRTGHEYVLLFSKGGTELTQDLINRGELTLTDESGQYLKGRELRKWGGVSLREDRPGQWFALKTPDGTKVWPIRNDGKDGHWRWGPENPEMKGILGNPTSAHWELRPFDKGVTWKGLRERWVPYEKVRTSEKPVGWKTWLDDLAYNSDGTRVIKEIFGEKCFDTPKPVELIGWVLSLVPSDSCLVLDSFAGSGTTGHAVLEANASDGGSRRFILIEGEDYADKLTAERVRRVMKGYKFEGTQKEELIRESVTYTTLKNPEKLMKQVEAVENLEGHRFDGIKKEVKDGELVVTGEKRVTKKTEGLGGEFTYCTLGEPIDLDKLLTGKSLPEYEAVGAWLFHTATGEALLTNKIRKSNWYLGESAAYHVWLVYKPELEFLKSSKASLTLELAEKIAQELPTAKSGKKHLVFAPAKYVPNKTLLPLGVEYAPLPFALYRVEKD
jgi:adenine-specific DNA-methyltransferase